MNIAYVSRFDSININNWSGSEYYIAKAIGEMQGNHIDYIAGLKEKLNLGTRFKYHIAIRSGKKYLINRSPYPLKQYAKQVKEQLKDLNSEIVFSPGKIPIAYLECDQPKVIYADATFPAMINYYDWYSNLSKTTIKEALKMGQKAIDSCSLTIFSSDWAAQSAIKYFGASPNKVKVVPFGANIDSEPTFEEIKISIQERDSTVCRILFAGVDWERKGGQMVLNTVKSLNKGGLPTELHIIGLDNLPNEITSLPFVFNHGFISKSTPEGFEKIVTIIKNSHFLFMPSKAEAYGLVYCEASAYGLPSIATKTGGVTTIIKDGKNGITFFPDASIADYSEYINATYQNKDKYTQLALSSFHEYETRLNWRVAGETISNHLKELL